jgi:cytidylate kinase
MLGFATSHDGQRTMDVGPRDDGGSGGPGMRAVTISREYGSGGGEIAQRLARGLGWNLVDHELVVQVARALGESEAEASALDERAEGFLRRVLDGMRWISPLTPDEPQLSLAEETERHRQALAEVIRSAVDAGQAVIVGRGAQAILADRRDVLHARVVAPLPLRVAYVARREGLSPGAARARILSVDQDRARYLQTVERVRPDEPHLYDLTINTAVLSLDDAVDLIAHALEAKSRRRNLPAEDLGPGAGLAPYPGQASRFGPRGMSSSSGSRD